MKRYLLKRLGQALLAVLGAATIVFFIIRLSGDPARLMLPPEASEEQVSALRESLGFNQPLWMQYLDYLRNLLTGDLGHSLYYKESALKLVLERMPATIDLAVFAILIAVTFGLLAGILSAYKKNSWIDYIVNAWIFLTQSLPVFWIGIVLIMVFAVRLHLLPTSGNRGLESIVLPAVTLAAYPIAPIARTMRASLLEVMDKGYMVTSRAQGFSKRRRVFKRGLKNAFLPVITVISLEFGVMIAGAVVTETIFSWPGVGQLIIQGVGNRDFPLVQASILVVSTIYIAITLITDLIYHRLDPRIKLQ
ncbi:ABC transporter permease [Saccharibacillus sp. CPCC 101409]|uniref:ABC transporter permease n=1 Tax=Saccharibacillus sp. CPCC 101409 TaxID=3058041 RepID=UPI002673E5F8|nr:ABC transporter permease [Saccharibacillus sp. CPCC 101409]MDO3412421.1 ABC transporter permease [Saccharibacillus sp. CPCC 101409]